MKMLIQQRVVVVKVLVTVAMAVVLHGTNVFVLLDLLERTVKKVCNSCCFKVLFKLHSGTRMEFYGAQGRVRKRQGWSRVLCNVN